MRPLLRIFWHRNGITPVVVTELTFISNDIAVSARILGSIEHNICSRDPLIVRTGTIYRSHPKADSDTDDAFAAKADSMDQRGGLIPLALFVRETSWLCQPILPMPNEPRWNRCLRQLCLSGDLANGRCGGLSRRSSICCAEFWGQSSQFNLWPVPAEPKPIPLQNFVVQRIRNIWWIASASAEF